MAISIRWDKFTFKNYLLACPRFTEELALSFFPSFSLYLVFIFWPKPQQKFGGKACTHWTWVFSSGGLMVIIWIIPHATSWASQRRWTCIVVNIRACMCFRKMMSYGGILEKSCTFFWNICLFILIHTCNILICVVFIFLQSMCFFFKYSINN